ncbi:MAG: extracellular solute-binding protein, partial [Frondihabitans sp.]|nr:extracellular solute-binding protein [Frondihabitans sp.]
MAPHFLPRRRSSTRVLAAASAFAVMIALAGCSSAGGSGTASGGTPSGTLNIAVSSGDASDAAFKAINASFEKKYPKVNIKFSSIPNNNYPAAKSSRLTANNVDILIAAPTQLPKYVSKGSESDDSLAADNGVFLDLTKQPFMKDYTPSLLKSLAYNGKQYTVPTGVSYYTGVFYNKTM